MKGKQKIGVYLVYIALCGLSFHALDTISNTFKIFSEQEVALIGELGCENEPNEDEKEKEDKYKLHNIVTLVSLHQDTEETRLYNSLDYRNSHCVELHTPPPEIA
ncbi:MAG: hypothetical protein OIF50_15600 [Flavobacteriaceae bacterium]|nr:hypothetical protein [Flavobacteriaceae bacterium]